MFKKLFAVAAVVVLTIALTGVSASAAPASLGKDEVADLQFMREEEKLAHDVYVTLHEKWGLTVFANIMESEQRHTDSIAALLDKYDLDDPAQGKGIGEFTNVHLGELYVQLIAQGAASEVEALKVGALIEDLDIVDLRECMLDTAKADILRVYQNLQDGSENHLRAFVGGLEAQGVTYEPAYLSAEEYATILAATSDSGNGRRGR